MRALQVVNGHVDNLACFIRPGVVALSWCDDVNDPQARSGPQHIKLLSIFLCQTHAG